MRLIDADKLIKRCNTPVANCWYSLERDKCPDTCSTQSVLYKDIASAPTIDAAPVVHAQWIDESGTIVCSHCHHKRNTADREYTMYCGHCGAKMDLKDGEKQ